MSRLTDTEYLIRHEQLHRLWHRGPDYFGFLTPKQQRELHTYYRTDSEASNDELLLERMRVSKEDPSLPHRASRAFLQLLQTPEPKATSKRGRASKNVTVRPVLKPDIDVAALTRALMEHVASLPKEERDKLAEEGRKMRKRREDVTA